MTDPPLVGFDPPLVGFDPPLVGFDPPLVGFDPPLVGFDPPLVGFDIETDTSVHGLDPDVSPIVAAALHGPGATEVFEGPEAELIQQLDAAVSQLPPGVLVTWNGASFDLPFVARRAALLDVPTGLRLWVDPRRRSSREPERLCVRGRWHDLVHLDGYLLYRADVGRTLRLPCGLKPLSRLVGLVPVEIDRACIHLASTRELADYVASDARLAVELVQRRMPLALAAADFPVGSAGVQPGSTSWTPLCHSGPTTLREAEPEQPIAVLRERPTGEAR